MNQFITLQSGLRVNTSHILEYSDHDGKLRIIQSSPSVGGFAVVTEDMTAEQLDDLLSGPAIVDPAINLDKLKPGAACQFTYEGQVKHGVIESIQMGWNKDQDRVPTIEISRDGVFYTLWTDDGTVDISD